MHKTRQGMHVVQVTVNSMVAVHLTALNTLLNTGYTLSD